MASANETVEEIVKRVRRECNSYPLPTAAAEMLKLVREFHAAHEREIAEKDAEIAELRGALKKAYNTLYSISCARYGKGLTCTDSTHELVTMARECADELYADENLRKALEGASDE